MVNRDNAFKLKLYVFFILLVVNISVFCIWIPARLQINQTYIKINSVWDRVEKGIFLVVDAGLNFYFIHLVKSRLIANGLTKYNRLFKVNLVMIAISMTMDVCYRLSSTWSPLTNQVLLIAMMSLPNDIVYLQFHPLAYLVKLHIEMNMAELITKVVKASNPGGYYSHSQSEPKSTQRGPTNGSRKIGSMFAGGNTTFIEAGGNDIELPNRDGAGGIQKTMTTQVVIKQSSGPSEYDDAISESSSTRQLKREHFPV